VHISSSKEYKASGRIMVNDFLQLCNNVFRFISCKNSKLGVCRSLGK